MDYRGLFDGIETSVTLSNGQSTIPINFDNAATTPPFKFVNKTVEENIKIYSSIGRGSGQKSELCTDKYEESREKVLEFFNLPNRKDYTVVYVKNTTEGLNLLANALIKDKTDKVLITRMEHHANDLPWRNKATVSYVEIDELGRINLNDIEDKLIENKGTIKYLSITGASNVTGYINPINKIAKIAHKYGAKIIIDAAQLVAHEDINMAGKSSDESIDFIVFSAHKMYAPYGTGVIVGLKSYLSNVYPMLEGGGAVEAVLDYDVIWKECPQLHEAGTQNYLGVMATIAAMDSIKKIGFNKIISHEQIIKEYLINELKKISSIKLYGDTEYIDDRLGVITFNIDGKHYEDVAEILANDFGISTRCGKFCAHPYVNRLLTLDNKKININERRHNHEDIGMIRMSLGLYNTMDEAKYVVQVMKYISEYL